MVHGPRIILKLDPARARKVLVLVLLGLAPAELGSEMLTITTTYPSPSGIYRSLVTTGGGAANQNTVLNRDGGNAVLSPNATNAAGWVGVGASAPTSDPRGAKLNVGGNLDMNDHQIINVALAPINPGDAASKAYVDAQAGGGPAGWTCTVRSATVSGTTDITSAVTCSSGEKVISGGCSSPPSGTGVLQWFQNGPTIGSQGWQCGSYDNIPRTLTAIANCCR